MDRETTLDYLADLLSVSLTEANIPATDTPEGLGRVLDTVAAWFVAIPDLDASWANPLALYYTWDRIVQRLAMNMDVAPGGGESYKLSQQRDFAASERDKAFALVSWMLTPGSLGGGSDGITIFEMPFLDTGEWNEDWILV